MSCLSEQYLSKGQTFKEVSGNAPRFPSLRTIVSLKCNSGGGFYSVCEPTFRFPRENFISHESRVPVMWVFSTCRLGPIPRTLS